jgi:hypothetical protein
MIEVNIKTGKKGKYFLPEYYLSASRHYSHWHMRTISAYHSPVFFQVISELHFK